MELASCHVVMIVCEVVGNQHVNVQYLGFENELSKTADRVVRHLRQGEIGLVLGHVNFDRTAPSTQTLGHEDAKILFRFRK